MRRLYQVLLYIGIAILVFVFMLAFWDDFRAWARATLGPPLGDTGGTIVAAITGNPIWQNYIMPFPNQALIFGAVIYIPLFILFLKSRTKVRRLVFKSAAKDSGMFPTMTEPVSSRTTYPEPTPTSTAKKEEPKPQPQPTPESEAPKEEAT